VTCCASRGRAIQMVSSKGAPRKLASPSGCRRTRCSKHCWTRPLGKARSSSSGTRQTLYAEWVPAAVFRGDPEASERKPSGWRSDLSRVAHDHCYDVGRSRLRHADDWSQGRGDGSAQYRRGREEGAGSGGDCQTRFREKAVRTRYIPRTKVSVLAPTGCLPFSITSSSCWKSWLGELDSNQHWRSQSPLSYR
jgi:hypothetical protein